MKRMNLFMMAMMLVVMLIGFVSCNKEHLGKKEDPAGAIEAFVRNDDRWSFATISLGQYDYTYNDGYSTTSFEGKDLEVGLDIDGSNNFFLRYDGGSGGEMKEKFLVNVGKVEGLGYIETVPTSGWTARLAVQPGCGYIIRYRGSENQRWGYTIDPTLERYARFYVIEWMTSTTGGIIGAKVRFQPEWTPSK